MHVLLIRRLFKMNSQSASLAVLTDRRTYPGKGMNFEMEDYSAATENMLLAAVALGYVSLWLDSPFFNHEKQEAAKKALGVPDEMHLRAVLPIGLPDGPGTRREKLSYNERVFYRRYTL